MRLIDADVLLARIRLNYNEHQNINAAAMKDIIDTTKTAYDVEKVVAEVKKLSFEWLGDIRTCDVIRLVRKGGVE